MQEYHLIHTKFSIFSWKIKIINFENSDFSKLLRLPVQSLEFQKFFSITRTNFFSQSVRTILVTKYHNNIKYCSVKSILKLVAQLDKLMISRCLSCSKDNKSWVLLFHYLSTSKYVETSTFSKQRHILRMPKLVTKL